MARPLATDTSEVLQMSLLLRLRVLLCAALTLLCCSTATAQTTSPAAPQLFSPSSFWNERLADDAPLDGLSSTYVNDLQRQLQTWKPWINTTEYSTPYYVVGTDVAPSRVKLDKPFGANMDLAAAWASVPIPAGAKPAGGTDSQLVVYQPATDTMWEFWQLSQQLDGWHARWGGRMLNVSSNPGYYNAPSDWGATGTSLPKIGGTMLLSELASGHIDHAIAMGIPQPKAHILSWPAQRTDGFLYSPAAIPEGTRFRLDPKLDLSTLRLTPIVRMIAEAAQRYGMVVRDKSGSISLYAEDPTPTGRDPFWGTRGYFAGRSPSQLLQDQFPWSRLQALKTELRPG